jgi:hypothetical protein
LLKQWGVGFPGKTTPPPINRGHPSLLRRGKFDFVKSLVSPLKRGRTVTTCRDGRG